MEVLPYYGVTQEDGFLPLSTDIGRPFFGDCRDSDVLERWRFREDEFLNSEDMPYG